MTKRWYVVRTKPNSDSLAASAIGGEGFELFFPKVDIPTQNHQPKRVPLFPGYLFLRCDILGHDLPMISRLPGILGWVRFGADIPHVPDEVMQGLRTRVESIHNSGGLWERFRPGQLVRVAQGKLGGLATVLDEPASPEGRVRVLLEFMGRQVHATVPWRSLSPLPEDQVGGSAPKRSRRTRGRGRWVRGFGPRSLARG